MDIISLNVHRLDSYVITNSGFERMVVMKIILPVSLSVGATTTLHTFLRDEENPKDNLLGFFKAVKLGGPIKYAEINSVEYIEFSLDSNIVILKNKWLQINFEPAIDIENKGAFIGYTIDI